MGGNVVWYFVTLLYDSINNSMASNILTPTLTRTPRNARKKDTTKGWRQGNTSPSWCIMTCLPCDDKYVPLQHPPLNASSTRHSTSVWDEAKHKTLLAVTDFPKWAEEGVSLYPHRCLPHKPILSPPTQTHSPPSFVFIYISYLTSQSSLPFFPSVSLHHTSYHSSSPSYIHQSYSIPPTTHPSHYHTHTSSSFHLITPLPPTSILHQWSITHPRPASL